MGVGVGTQGELIPLSAADYRSRLGSNPSTPTKFQDKVMPIIEKVVEVDLDDFTTQELRDELNWRGESDTDISEFDH